MAVQDALNSRFSNMHKAFQYVDVDNSGGISASELIRVMKLWNVQVDEQVVVDLMNECDPDSDGKVTCAARRRT